MVPRSDALNNGTDPRSDFPEHWRQSGILGEQGEKRRFVRDESSEEIGTLGGQPECDRSAKRVSGDPRRRESQMLDQRREIGDVLPDATLCGWALAFAVTAPVIGENPKRLGQTRNDKIPAVMGHPRPVDKDERNFTGTAELIKDLDAVDVCRCHVRSLRQAPLRQPFHPKG
jgi:hypothetical protein